MDFSLNEDQITFQHSTRSFLESKGDLKIPRNFTEGKEDLMDELWQGLADLGYMGITIPEEFEGLGLGSLSLVPILEEMGRCLVPGPYPETVAFAVPLIEKFGSDEQKKKYLPQIATGKCRFTLALFEQGGDLSPANIQLKAIKKENDYVLNGEKVLVPYADFANTIIIPVRTGGSNSEYGISLLLVDTDQMNVDMKIQQSMDETRKMAQLTFNEVRISKTSLLGPENAGWGVLEAGLLHLDTAWSSSLVGGIERTVEMAVEYAKTRQQFGQPIGRFQANKHKIANMKIDLESARSLSYYAAWALENDANDMVEAICMAHSFTSESAIRTAQDNIQIHGGMGFTWEFDCHLFLKRAMSLENHLGSQEDARERLALELGW